jgi:oligopeptide transport system ATP-binding protein
VPPLVEVKDLKKHFPVGGGLFTRSHEWLYAVDGVSFHIDEGETLGLVGESGCGKTTTGRLLLRLLEPTDGEVLFQGRNIFDMGKKEIRQIRREMQIVFQDPFSSLNPRKTIYQILSKPFKNFGSLGKNEVEDKVLESLKAVGLDPPELFLDRFPHEFSGGQKRRVGVARAIAVRPKFVLLDEPVSALDMSVKGQILKLLRDLQSAFRLTYLFITHELAVVRSLCDRVAVMYLGKLVEIATVKELYETPVHPYTQALLSATPIPDPEMTRNRKIIVLKGDVPSPINPPPGCRFHPRCNVCKTKCAKTEPTLVDVGEGHMVSCHINS